MKLKKLLLFILIFFFFLVIKNNVSAYVLEYKDIATFYMKDLPVSEDSNNIFILDTTNNTIYLFSNSLEGNNFVYEARSKRIYLFDSNRGRCSFTYYTCSYDILNISGDIVCNDWIIKTSSGILAMPEYLQYLGGNDCIYPGMLSANNNIATNLPDGISWGDNILIGVNGSYLYLYTYNKRNNYVFVSTDNGEVYYRPSYDSTDNSNSSFTRYVYNYDTGVWSLDGTYNRTKDCKASTLLYYHEDILNSSDGSVLFSSTDNIFNCLYTYKDFPYILNGQEDLAKGEQDIIIMPGDFKNNEKIIFNLCLSNDNDISDILTSIELDFTSQYYCGVDDTGLGYYYKIPWDFIKDYLEKGKQYVYEIKYDYDEVTYTKDVYATYGGLTDGDVIHNSINEQTKVMEEYYKRQEEILKKQQETADEQLETSKGIWGTLKEVLSFINPFSENFFVYKLIDLLIEAIKSLFIPSNEFFNDYFNELMKWFSDRLGFLAYPLELILNVLNRIVSINFTEPIIQIPNFVEPSTGQKIISSQTYNLNSLLENSIFKTCHDVYFVLVDAVIIFGLVNLLKNKLEEVFTK